MHSSHKIRDYILEQKIGEGGMGEVWSARHAVLQRQVAIKAMVRQLAADPRFEERFLQEARSQAALQHPRIVGVTDFFTEDGVHYLVMPLVAGESLADRMKRSPGPLPLADSLAITRDLLDALDYAHQRGIIHRDVKPSNIMLDLHGHAYLMDFGISLDLGQRRLTRTGSSMGTSDYISPEQIRNPKKLDHRTDVYSVGCVLYEMLAGRPPFLIEDGEGDTDFALKEAHMYHTPQPIRTWNAAIPAALDGLVLRALEKDPDRRYSGCGELRRALETWDLPAADTHEHVDVDVVPNDRSPAKASKATTYATFGRRFAAYLLDTFIVLVGQWIPLLSIDQASLSEDEAMVLLVGLLFGIPWLYFALFESSPWQGTPGKRAFGLAVTDLEERRISFGRATGRHLAKFLSAIPINLGFLAVLWSPKKQAWHDSLTGCLVLKKR